MARTETHTVRGIDKNGYWSWARFGYDAAIPPERLPRLLEALAGAEWLCDLMTAPEGGMWWKTRGKSIHMTFDLTGGPVAPCLKGVHPEERDGRREKVEQPDFTDEDLAIMDEAWGEIGEQQRRAAPKTPG